MDTVLERIRKAELESLKSHFPRGSLVLELGGGSGYQAAILFSWGSQVHSIDVATRPDPRSQQYGGQYYTVSTYDGQNIPVTDSSFDIVYSSHVLYHAVDTDSMLAEIRRVLRPGGTAIHVLPSASWRLWTTLAHYPNLVRKLLMRPGREANVSESTRKPPPPPVSNAAPHAASPHPAGRPNRSSNSSPSTAAPQRLSLLRKARLLLTVRPLGPSSDVTEEWSSFRNPRWRAAFLAAGFSDVKALRGPLFYTGHLMTPGLPFGLRSFLAYVLGPASFAWTMRR
jgi:SAM-dependent methyltransferase